MARTLRTLALLLGCLALALPASAAPKGKKKKGAEEDEGPQTTSTRLLLFGARDDEGAKTTSTDMLQKVVDILSQEFEQEEEMTDLNEELDRLLGKS